MGAIRTPTPVKLICAMLSGERSLLAQAADALSREYGPIDLASEVTAFGWTGYYRHEMGEGILRQFLSFERLIQPDEIAAIKVKTNEVEEERRDRKPESGIRNPEQQRQNEATTETEREAASGCQSPINSKPTIKPLITRLVNLDPGYVTESKLVLASTKGLSHRIYLSRGIFAEVTLTYVHGRWQGHAYTFPDYASGAYDAFLTEVRSILRRQLGRKERKA